MKVNKKCAICGEGYSYCTGCKADMDMPRWKFLFHDENCKKIYDVINDYKTKVITVDKAKAELSKLKLPKFVPGFKITVDEILGNGGEKKKKSDDVVEK